MRARPARRGWLRVRARPARGVWLVMPAMAPMASRPPAMPRAIVVPAMPFSVSLALIAGAAVIGSGWVGQVGGPGRGRVVSAFVPDVYVTAWVAPGVYI